MAEQRTWTIARLHTATAMTPWAVIEDDDLLAAISADDLWEVVTLSERCPRCNEPVDAPSRSARLLTPGGGGS